MHTNEDSEIWADLLLSSRLLFKELLLTVGTINYHQATEVASEITLWPQVLFVLLLDSHKKVFLTKSFSCFMHEDHRALQAPHWYISAYESLCHCKPNQEALALFYPQLLQVSMSVYTQPPCSCLTRLWTNLPSCVSVWASWPGLYPAVGCFLPPFPLFSKMSEQFVQSMLLLEQGHGRLSGEKGLGKHPMP